MHEFFPKIYEIPRKNAARKPCSDFLPPRGTL
jgi:hypothetical protein